MTTMIGERGENMPLILTDKWNTGRQYSAEGQIITATLMNDGERVCFEDQTRHIAGVFKVRGFKLVGDRLL